MIFRKTYYLYHSLADFKHGLTDSSVNIGPIVLRCLRMKIDTCVNKIYSDLT